MSIPNYLVNFTIIIESLKLIYRIVYIISGRHILDSIGERSSDSHTLLFSSTGVDVTLLGEGEATPGRQRFGSLPPLPWPSVISFPRTAVEEAGTEKARSRWIRPGQGSSERRSGEHTVAWAAASPMALNAERTSSNGLAWRTSATV